MGSRERRSAAAAAREGSKTARVFRSIQNRDNWDNPAAHRSTEIKSI